MRLHRLADADPSPRRLGRGAAPSAAAPAPSVINSMVPRPQRRAAAERGPSRGARELRRSRPRRTRLAAGPWWGTPRRQPAACSAKSLPRRPAWPRGRCTGRRDGRWRQQQAPGTAGLGPHRVLQPRRSRTRSYRPIIRWSASVASASSMCFFVHLLGALLARGGPARGWRHRFRVATVRTPLNAARNPGMSGRSSSAIQSFTAGASRRPSSSAARRVRPTMRDQTTWSTRKL